MDDKNTLSFRTNKDKKAALDAIAASIKRDRSFVINEAIQNYIELNAWQVQHIQYGIEQADAGEFASEKDLKAVFKKFRTR